MVVTRGGPRPAGSALGVDIGGTNIKWVHRTGAAVVARGTLPTPAMRPRAGRRRHRRDRGRTHRRGRRRHTARSPEPGPSLHHHHPEPRRRLAGLPAGGHDRARDREAHPADERRTRVRLRGTRSGRRARPHRRAVHDHGHRNRRCDRPGRQRAARARRPNRRNRAHDRRAGRRPLRMRGSRLPGDSGGRPGTRGPLVPGPHLSRDREPGPAG